ncbi:MAG: ABC transporter ATP-binding protein [Armatimonadetes bacterium]|nr:ABC transporter ATP-binding protein [Armatimonadota bacterium]
MRDFEYLQMENLEKAFGGLTPVRALGGVNMKVAQGEFAALVGASGCGKSTLLRIIAGLDTPSAGRAFFHREDGDEPIESPSRDRAMVFQSYTSFPWLSVRRNVEFPLLLHPDGGNREERKAKVDHYLELMGLTEFASQYPNTLSGGMRQRVAIARTLVNEPGLLLMDEPFGALDAQTRWQMQDLLLNVWGSSRCTVLFVTHDIEEAVYLADKVYVFSPRPGVIRAVKDIDFPRPRDPDIKLTDRFKTLQVEILNVITETVMTAAKETAAGGRGPEDLKKTLVEKPHHGGDGA